MVQRRVLPWCQLPADIRHRRVRPVDAVDWLALQDAVDGGLELEQAVVLHRQADPRPLDDRDQRRSDRSHDPQPSDAEQLEPPPAGGPDEQCQQAQPAHRASQRRPEADVLAEHPEEQHLETAEDGEVGNGGGQPGGDPGQRRPKSTGRRWGASHDDGVTPSVRNPFSRPL